MFLNAIYCRISTSVGSELIREKVICFKEYEEAFDRVQHYKLVQMMRLLDIDQKDIGCISKTCNATNQLQLDNEVTKAQKILKGVRQGCVLSPLLLNINSEYIFQEASAE